MSTENAKKSFTNEESHLLKTGEFARLANINRDTLTFYIKKGLIHPVYTGENKYKYFAPEQVQTISFIKCLRRCLIPIEVVRTILSDPSNERLRFHISAQREYLEEQMCLLKEASVFIDDYKKEKDFLDSKEPEIPFIQYCEKQTVNVFPVRFCQPFHIIPDLRDIVDYLNNLSKHMNYYPSVCVIPSDTPGCTGFCHAVTEKSLLNPPAVDPVSEYTTVLEEGYYAMIIGRSRMKKMDSNLSLLRKKIEDSGYRADDRNLYLFVESSLLKVPESSGERYMMKMKIRKKENG